MQFMLPVEWLILFKQKTVMMTATVKWTSVMNFQMIDHLSKNF